MDREVQKVVTSVEADGRVELVALASGQVVEEQLEDRIATL
jgi:hypothetical protein